MSTENLCGHRRNTTSARTATRGYESLVDTAWIKKDAEGIPAAPCP